VYTPAEIERVVAWTEQHRIHLVMDEIYALSVFGTTRFTSVLGVRPELGDAIHIVWAFSKDFGASGLRTGVLLSQNEAVLKAIDALAYWACCSGHTQHVLGEMIDDAGWVDGFVAESRARLASAYQSVTAALEAQNLEYLASDAGFFLVLDLRRFLEAPSFDAERALWLRLLDETNVNLTPGAACRIAEPGFMRLCFAAVPSDVAALAVERLGRALR
jgi:1-aminocyclopropane-1-carboxylate synthase